MFYHPQLCCRLYGRQTELETRVEGYRVRQFDLKFIILMCYASVHFVHKLLIF